jgi:hypothetical protein
MELQRRMVLRPFQQWPVIRLPEARLLVLDPRHLM